MATTFGSRTALERAGLPTFGDGRSRRPPPASGDRAQRLSCLAGVVRAFSLSQPPTFPNRDRSLLARSDDACVRPPARFVSGQQI